MDAMRDSKWIRLDRLCLADLPKYGNVPGCYLFREAASGEVIYIGSTKALGHRLFGNHLGGVGGPTTQRVHAAFFEPEVLAGVEVAWIESSDYRTLEVELKRQFALLGAQRLPRWTKR
jgi:hypothetical protein